MKRVLVVDDEQYILDELQEALTEEGYLVHTATNVDDAFSLLVDETDINLVTTDLRMPGKTGLELISSVRSEIGRDIQFVIISGNAYQDYDGNNAVDNIVQLRKPLDVEILFNVLMNLKNSSQPQYEV